MTSSILVASSILVVDDESDFLSTSRRLLSRDGFRVVEGATRSEALAALAREAFALVIADERLPEGDGLDVVRAAPRRRRRRSWCLASRRRPPVMRRSMRARPRSTPGRSRPPTSPRASAPHALSATFRGPRASREAWLPHRSRRRASQLRAITGVCCGNDVAP
jgi:CheY-like chemotaxis protein